MQRLIRFLAVAALVVPGFVLIRPLFAANDAAAVVPNAGPTRAGTWLLRTATGVRITDESTDAEAPVETDPAHPEVDEPASPAPEVPDEGSVPPGADEGAAPAGPEEGAPPPAADEGTAPDQGVPPAPEPVMDGQALFQANCAICHGRQAEGRVGPRIAGTQLSLEQVLQQVRTPRNLMPPFGPDRLSDDQVAAIYAYLQTLGTE